MDIIYLELPTTHVNGSAQRTINTWFAATVAVYALL